jgi:hypothetical protein
MEDLLGFEKIRICWTLLVRVSSLWNFMTGRVCAIHRRREARPTSGDGSSRRPFSARLLFRK